MAPRDKSRFHFIVLSYINRYSTLDIVGSLGNRLSVITEVVCLCRPHGSAVRNQVPPLAIRLEEGAAESCPS